MNHHQRHRDNSKDYDSLVSAFVFRRPVSSAADFISVLQTAPSWVWNGAPQKLHQECLPEQVHKARHHEAEAPFGARSKGKKRFRYPKRSCIQPAHLNVSKLLGGT
jgi:hypothetical protein